MGVGAALIFPATLSLISNVFTERTERARAIGLWGASAGVASRGGARAGADRRRLAARALLVDEHLLRHDAGGRARRCARRTLRADLARPVGPEGRPAGPRALDRGDGHAHLHDHRGA